jgi:hypothetical protein
MRRYDFLMRGTILSEIQRLAKENGGQPPGAQLFEQRTGIRTAAWRGKYWARWGDAVAEAGFVPNKPIAKIDESHLLEKLAEACRVFGKIPTYAELRLYRRDHPDFPHRAITNRFGSNANMLGRLSEWASANGAYADVAALLAERVTTIEVDSKPRADGFVYLIQWGANYKIGRGEQLERRVKQVRTGLPDSGKLVHAIKTDDPSGIEAYWHRRFAEKRAENGEWFKLTRADVAAFKRRKFQ